MLNISIGKIIGIIKDVVILFLIGALFIIIF